MDVPKQGNQLTNMSVVRGRVQNSGTAQTQLQPEFSQKVLHLMSHQNAETALDGNEMENLVRHPGAPQKSKMGPRAMSSEMAVVVFQRTPRGGGSGAKNSQNFPQLTTSETAFRGPRKMVANGPSSRGFAFRYALPPPPLVLPRCLGRSLKKGHVWPQIRCSFSNSVLTLSMDFLNSVLCFVSPHWGFWALNCSF